MQVLGSSGEECGFGWLLLHSPVILDVSIISPLPGSSPYCVRGAGTQGVLPDAFCCMFCKVKTKKETPECEPE